MRQGAKDNAPPSNIVMGEEYYIGKGAFVTTSSDRLAWFRNLLQCVERTSVTGNLSDERYELKDGLEQLSKMMRLCHNRGGKVIFIGNGGSAAIASHMSVDYSKNKGIRAISLSSNTPMMTCLANDFGYEQVFAKQVEWYGREEDIVVIISSSGRSPNIIAAAGQALESQLTARVTFSGMNPNNALRKRGNLNFYVPSTDYGLVELAHLALLHSVASCGS